MSRYNIIFSFCFLLFTLNVFASGPDTSIAKNLVSVQDNEKVEMEIQGFSEFVSGSYTVLLKEKGTKGDVLLPIVVGGCEAIALSRELTGEPFPRPLTYPLLCNMFDSLGITLKAVVITELKDNTFYAVLVLEQNGKRWEIDARPSDAMNLAIRKKCKIFSYRKVIDAAGVKR